jgi:outer membrane protein OmpA-like peptidoglycan-associated protein
LYNNRVKSVVDYIESSIKYSYTYVTEEGGSKTYISEVVNNDIAEVGFQFPEIYFDYNSSYLSKKDEKELTGLVKKLLENPLLKVEIKTKTDSRGSNKYNLFLSDKRLNRIKEYLILNGISSNRIVGFSLGESQILNKCIDQSECTDLEHRINRGVNFKFSLQE